MTQFSQLDKPTQAKIRWAIDLARVQMRFVSTPTNRGRAWARPSGEKIAWGVSVDGMDTAQGSVER